MLMFVAGSKFNSQVHHFFSLTNEWRQRGIRIFVSKNLKNIKVAMRRDFFATKRFFEPARSFKIIIPWKTDKFNYIEKSWKYHSFDEKRIFGQKSEGFFGKARNFFSTSENDIVHCSKNIQMPMETAMEKYPYFDKKQMSLKSCHGHFLEMKVEFFLIEKIIFFNYSKQ